MTGQRLSTRRNIGDQNTAFEPDVRMQNNLAERGMKFSNAWHVRGNRHGAMDIRVPTSVFVRVRDYIAQLSIPPIVFAHHAALLILALLSWAIAAHAQTPEASPADAPPGSVPTVPADGNNAPARGTRRNFDRGEMQNRMLTRLRDEMGVTDDQEWKLISDRIQKLMELRRASGPFGGFGLGGPRGANGNARGMNAPSSAEVDALRSAIDDKLPDAEVKARLERLRDTRAQAEAQLAKARDDLRSVLTVRQEAIAVLAGLLP